MADRESLGEFEHHVLLTILRLGDDAYTTTILKELEARTGREVSLAAIYIALRRLEAGGLVRTRMRRSLADGQNRERRYVRVSAAGLKRLRASQQRFLRLWDGLEHVLQEG